MKLMKSILSAIMVVALSLSVTSCLDDESNAAWGSEFVKVNTENVPITFTNSSGVELIPSSSILSVDSECDMAIVNYQYNKDKANENPLNIVMISEPYYFPLSNIENLSVAEEANASIMTLSPEYYDGVYYTGQFFDRKTLILPIQYKYKEYSSSTEQKNEMNAHSFVLVYDPDNCISGGTLNLELRHVIDESYDDIECTSDAMNFFAFDISAALNGSTITKVSISANENASSDDLGVTKRYDYDYNFN